VNKFLLQRYYIHRRWQVLKELGVPHDPPSILNIGNLRSNFTSPEQVSAARCVHVQANRDFFFISTSYSFQCNSIQRQVQLPLLCSIFFRVETVASLQWTCFLLH